MRIMEKQTMAGYVHGEHDDSDTPAVDDLLVSFFLTLSHNFRREIAWSTTHCLWAVSAMVRSVVSNEDIAYSQHGETIDRLGKTEVCHFNNGWDIIC